VDNKDSFIRKDTSTTDEIRKCATEFFGRALELRFHEPSGIKVDMLEDYVKEAESLFKV
jgi:hypothetical protein